MLFNPGRIVATPGALEATTHSYLAKCLKRHLQGDWGDMCFEDKAANDLALKEGSRLMSSYPINGDDKLWIITEWDRSVTTFLLPSEY